MSHWLDTLNPAQREAVTAPLTHMMVLAGAGSGKTRVLVHRIAYLYEHFGVSPERILAVTFTNKAAGEMRGRVESLFGIPTQHLWIGTFHGIAHRLLRIHHRLAKLPDSFQVLDSDDQYRLVRRVLKQLHLDEKHWAPKQLQYFINNQKDAGLRANDIEPGDDFYLQTQTKVYAAYEALCEQSGLVDFAELLLRTDELFRDNADLLAQYQERFAHVLVDEFQDTNTIQYRWLKRLIGSKNTLTVVGDDDQSIYAWRGAKVENIQHFETDFPKVKTVRLEQNYRSTGTILKASNSLISNNSERLGKELWTDAGEGEPISLYAGFNELDEAKFVVSRIEEAILSGHARREIAVLYRSNAQSRVLEEALLQKAIPYRVYGGQRFFERAEIKNALAYLRLIKNADDDAAFERIINTPTRGIGNKTLDTLRQTARDRRCSLWTATTGLISENALTGRARTTVVAFVELIARLGRDIADHPIGEQVEHVIHHTGLIEFYKNEPGEKGQGRIDNLAELVTAASQYTPDVVPDETLDELSSFLAHAALEAGEGQAGKHQDSVQLMTMHSAKGLEFPFVFVVGMEEELFPPRQAMEDPNRMEEERRLCYVALTRAMQKLTLTYAEYRRVYGENQHHHPSRFLREVPSECIQEVRMKMNLSRPVSVSQSSARRFVSSAGGLTIGGNSFKVGQTVMHPKFGDGVILNYEGQGEQARLQIHFAAHGTKWLVAAYAKLETA